MADSGETDDPAPSVAARDDLAGVVDLFGSVTRAELSRALSELAFKRRTEVDDAAIAAAIDVGVAEYAIVPTPRSAVSVDGDPVDPTDPDDDSTGSDRDPTFLAVGPAAFPQLPEGAEDLPHILDVPDREVDREALSDAVLDRLSADAIDAINAGDTERLETLADVTYDIEAWAPVDAEPIRERILAEIDG
ncbi:DUF7109 family protein [Halorubrum tibetense]|uniref:Uncharacterized protein n=1 Tax=Halorubrum tibetense TaxID=175631 RepID=A0ABD5S8A6_9EURY